MVTLIGLGNSGSNTIGTKPNEGLDVVGVRTKKHNMSNTGGRNTNSRTIRSTRAPLFSSGNSIRFDWFATGRPTASTVLQRFIANYPITTSAPIVAFIYWRVTR